jgi:hypothetical protein
MNMLYLKTELDGAEGAEGALCNSKRVQVANLPAFCLITVRWNKSQEIETVLVKWVNMKGQNPKYYVCTVYSHIRSFVYFVNKIVQIVGKFEDPSQYNFIVRIFYILGVLFSLVQRTVAM